MVVYVRIDCFVNTRSSKKIIQIYADIVQKPLVVYISVVPLIWHLSMCILAGGQWSQTVGVWMRTEDSGCRAGKRSDRTGEHLQAEEPGEARDIKWEEQRADLRFSSVRLCLLSQGDEQLAQLRYERTDLMKRLEEDQEDLNELMKKHKALIAQVCWSYTHVQLSWGVITVTQLFFLIAQLFQ